MRNHVETPPTIFENSCSDVAGPLFSLNNPKTLIHITKIKFSLQSTDAVAETTNFS